MARDGRVDAYVANAAPFAQPILAELRDAVHAACPEVEEDIKWGMPAFLHRGRILAHMAAFKRHAAFGFWRGGEVTGGEAQDGMGQFGKISSLDDLPPRAGIEALVQKAAELAEAPAPVRQPKKKPPLPCPDDLQAAIDADPGAAAAFAGFSDSARRDYVEWIVDAKQPATRARRIAQAAEWIAQGKKRNWKYEKC